MYHALKGYLLVCELKQLKCGIQSRVQGTQYEIDNKPIFLIVLEQNSSSLYFAPKQESWFDIGGSP